MQLLKGMNDGFNVFLLSQEIAQSATEFDHQARKRLPRAFQLNGEHTAQIAKLRGQGLSGRAIARKLGISEGSVRRLTLTAA
jgi:DNA-binding NarL/FixJ family response regulator